jgi:hypothetical protein
MDNKEEQKEEVKVEEPKKTSKTKLDFNTIDVTTATDDDIIRSGLKHNTTGDKICYFLIVVVIVLAILPPVLRLLVPKPITEVERDVVYLDLSCFRTNALTYGSLHTEVIINYRDGNAKLANIAFSYTNSKDSTETDDLTNYAEISELERLNLKGVTRDVSEDGKNYSYKVDFGNNNELLNNSVLNNYSYVSGVEMDYLKGKGFYCSSKSEIKKEIVDVKTGERVK